MDDTETVVADSKPALRQIRLGHDVATKLAMKYLDSFLIAVAVGLAIGIPFVFVRKIPVAIIGLTFLLSGLAARRLVLRGDPVKAMHLFVFCFCLMLFPLMVFSTYLATPVILITALLPIYGAICGVRSASLLAVAFFGLAIVVQVALYFGIQIPRFFPTPPVTVVVVGIVSTVGLFLPMAVVFRELNGSIEAAQTELDSRKRVEIDLIRARENAEAASRAKSEFVSTVSHELRTPLTAIGGTIRLITGGMSGEVPDSMRSMLDIAQRNCDRLTRLVNDLLDLDKLGAEKGSFELQHQALMPLIEQALEGAGPYCAQHRVSFTLRRREDEVRVRVDGHRLQQVLLNFLSNAAKFSPENETVDISVSTNGDTVRVSVTDRGEGIPEEFHERIFQRFAQADSSDARRHNGVGLGLAISKDLIERMGGTIGFASERGKGSRFYVELPISDDRSAV